MTAQQSRYRILFEKWRNMHGYEMKDMGAALGYLQYLETCCSHQCTELQSTEHGINKVCVCCGAYLGLAKYRAVDKKEGSA